MINGLIGIHFTCDTMNFTTLTCYMWYGPSFSNRRWFHNYSHHHQFTIPSSLYDKPWAYCPMKQLPFMWLSHRLTVFLAFTAKLHRIAKEPLEDGGKYEKGRWLTQDSVLILMCLHGTYVAFVHAWALHDVMRCNVGLCKPRGEKERKHAYVKLRPRKLVQEKIK